VERAFEDFQDVSGISAQIKKSAQVLKAAFKGDEGYVESVTENLKQSKFESTAQKEK
jgi:hypothetical protein